VLNADAKILFWISTLLLVFVLVNIFVAIILNAYDVISKLDPDSSDASLFISMVQTQALKTIKGATTVAGGEGADEEEVRRGLKRAVELDNEGQAVDHVQHLPLLHYGLHQPLLVHLLLRHGLERKDLLLSITPAVSHPFHQEHLPE